MLDDRTRLHHMRDSAREAMAFCVDRVPADLQQDRMLLLAVTRALEIVGVAANLTSRTLQDEHPDIPWKLLIGMRNRLIHAYFAVDPDILRSTVKEDLPGLVAALDSILEAWQ